MDFLNNERQKREERLNHINAQFEAAKEAMDAEAAKLDNITEYIKKVRENIIEIAKREKEKIVEDAKHTAAKMIKDAEAYSVYQLAKAKRVLSNEMVDLAISVVEEKLKKGITEQDNEILVNRFLTDIEISKELFEKRIKQ
jgi:F-type H+-transporting ATPase subunit b